jgi:hypothetical protein
VSHSLNAYERVLLKGGANRLFLFALHMEDANSLQIGFGMETINELQRAHITGPLVHKYHLTPFIAWLKGLSPITGIGLTQAVEGKRHPLSSAGQTVDEYRDLLAQTPQLVLAAGRYLPMAMSVRAVDRPVVFAEAIERCRISAFGHPLTWDTQHVELNDGRFVWLAYDDDIDKIRIGMGYHDERNEKLYGLHTYAVGVTDAADFATHQYLYLDAPLQFMGLPPGWPIEMDRWLTGALKQKVMTDLVRLADRVWPGQVGPETPTTDSLPVIS